MKIQISSEVIDCLCNCSLLLGKCPDYSTATFMGWYLKDEIQIQIHFDSKEIWILNDVHDVLTGMNYLTLEGIAKRYDFKLIDGYTEDSKAGKESKK